MRGGGGREDWEVRGRRVSLLFAKRGFEGVWLKVLGAYIDVCVAWERKKKKSGCIR